MSLLSSSVTSVAGRMGPSTFKEASTGSHLDLASWDRLSPQKGCRLGAPEHSDELWIEAHPGDNDNNHGGEEGDPGAHADPTTEQDREPTRPNQAFDLSNPDQVASARANHDQALE